MFSASRGRYLDFCSGVAQRRSALLQIVFWTSTITPAEGSTAESSSTASTAWKKVPPWPPYSSGTSIFISGSGSPADLGFAQSRAVEQWETGDGRRRKGEGNTSSRAQRGI